LAVESLLVCDVVLEEVFPAAAVDAPPDGMLLAGPLATDPVATGRPCGLEDAARSESVGIASPPGVGRASLLAAHAIETARARQGTIVVDIDL
jgi:hypothetical protein